MSKTTKNWMDKLVENYRIPTEEEIQSKTENKKMLNVKGQNFLIIA